MAVFIIVVVLVLGTVIAVQVAAIGQTDVATTARADEVLNAAQSAFMAKLTEFTRSGNELTIRPRFKKDAPTMTVTVAGGSASVWWSKWSSHYAGPIPMGRNHALWVARKKRKVARAISALPATQASSAQGPINESER